MSERQRQLCIVIVNMYFSPVAQRARVWLCNGITDTGRLYIGAESRVSSCVTGWPVIHQDGVQAVRLCNGLAGYTSGRSPGCLVA